MSEKEMHFIKVLKAWVLGFGVTSLISLIGALLIIWQTGIVNAEKMNNFQREQDSQKCELQSKADCKTVETVKTDLEKEIKDKFGIISGQLDLVIKLLPMTNNYNYKTTTNNDKK